MTDQGSISGLLEEARLGKSTAIDAIWQRYYKKLCKLASKKLMGVSRRVEDEEDVVVRAFNSFCTGAAMGRFPKLSDRQDLWQILVMLTARKAADQIKAQMCEKRGGTRVRGESFFANPSSANNGAGVDQIVGDEPTPEFAARVAEQFSSLLDLLGDDSLKRVAIAKMDGYTNNEIANQLGVKSRTIERKLRIIREIWSLPEQ